MKVAILQSNYIPWKGYFDMINMVDKFVLYDTEQYTRRDWRNRNLIKTKQGLLWLSIPVEVKGKFFQSINETKVSENNWGEKHWKTIYNNYAKAPFFKQYAPLFEPLFIENNHEYLSLINYSFIKVICSIIGCETEILWSSDFNIIGEKSEKLLSICKQLNATEYISGPAAQCYLDTNLFTENNIKVTWMDYSGYSEYNQFHPPFEHGVTILDLIFNEGPNAKKYLKSFQ